MQITQLPALSRALQTGDVFAMEDSSGITRKVDVSRIQPTPLVLSIPTGQWSGSGSDRYITVTASNVTADSVLVPHYDNASAALLNGPVWCVPAAGSFTVHTSAIPSGTVNIMVQFVGTLGEAQYQVLADVYSTSQVDSKIAQSTAMVHGTATINSDVFVGNLNYEKVGRIVIVTGEITKKENVVIEHQTNVATGLPTPFYGSRTYALLRTGGTQNIRVALGTTGNLFAWYDGNSSTSTAVYIVHFMYYATVS